MQKDNTQTEKTSEEAENAFTLATHNSVLLKENARLKNQIQIMTESLLYTLRERIDAENELKNLLDRVQNQIENQET